MNFPSTGFHHITMCAGKAQEDIDFFTQVMGQRLIKQTILFDGRYAHYHLYYANGHIDPGSVMTTFPYSRVQGRTGSGQVQSSVYSVKEGALQFWVEHLDRNKVPHCGIEERFGQRFLGFKHPAGLGIEVIEDARETRQGTATQSIGAAESARGFNSAVFSVREIAEDERFLEDALGFRKTGVDGRYHRFEIGKGGPGCTVELFHDADRPSGSRCFGAGTVHHVAFNVPTDEDLNWQKGYYEELGYTDVSEVKDRNYFHSIYVRAPGGVLIECAATAAGGFTKDEAFNELGTHLLLPAWFEERREEIMAMLEPILVPEWHPKVAIDAKQPIASHRKPVFIQEGVVAGVR